MLIYQEFLATTINEELAAFDPNERLRWAVHEIVTTKLKPLEEMKFEAMAIILKKSYKINISADILEEMFRSWDRVTDPDYTIFKKDDKAWLDIYTYWGTVKRKAKKDKQSFGKHRKKEPVSYSYPASTGRSTHLDYGYGSAGYVAPGYKKPANPTTTPTEDEEYWRSRYGWD